MVATTIEQSKKLIELGLSADSADMYYYNNDEIPQIISDIKSLKENINPKFYTLAWSLSALIELMPKYLLNDDDEEFGLEIVTTYKNEYEVCYQELLPPIYSPSLFDAIFQMICYQLENKLI